METLKLIDFDEVKDMAVGKVGTPSRDEYEREYSEWKRREDEERTKRGRRASNTSEVKRSQGVFIC